MIRETPGSSYRWEKSAERRPPGCLLGRKILHVRADGGRHPHAIVQPTPIGSRSSSSAPRRRTADLRGDRATVTPLTFFSALRQIDPPSRGQPSASGKFHRPEQTRQGLRRPLKIFPRCCLPSSHARGYPDVTNIDYAVLEPIRPSASFPSRKRAPLRPGPRTFSAL